MEIKIIRYNTEEDYTDGILLIDGQFRCFTIEDGYNDVKIYGETRIPDGCYNLELRTVGGFHSSFKARYGDDFHKGMLWVKDVPGFEYILIHTGNTAMDTAGCLVVGKVTIKDKGYVGDSRNAYKSIYPEIAQAIESEETVTITYQTIW